MTGNIIRQGDCAQLAGISVLRVTSHKSYQRMRGVLSRVTHPPTSIELYCPTD
jgi:hypothetical protein